MKSLVLRSREIEAATQRVLSVAVPLGAISLVTQVRTTVDVDEDLIPSIKAHGQQTPGVAVALTPTRHGNISKRSMSFGGVVII